MCDEHHLKARSILDNAQIPNTRMFIVGTFDYGVTVRSQQTRALNLVWALTEASEIPTFAPGEEQSQNQTIKIAIVGGGFAGLSAAAGLLRKGVKAQITIFEQCDTLLPLQQGSDTRWLHPHIYNWPAEGSEANAAMLPVLNWTAARASDVVVQIMTEWKNVVEASPNSKPVLYCNTRHLHIHKLPHSQSLQIEWIGEKRNSDSAAIDGDHSNAVGETDDFDLVILAVGFGLESDSALSYWRNDTIGQPHLEQPRLTYLISGQGDGAMVDLLRLRISQYRQDRILGELFGGVDHLLNVVKKIYEEYEIQQKSGVFEAFDELRSKSSCEFTKVLHALRGRLRRDTDVILHFKLRKLSDLFEAQNTKISFQNKLLVYLLYKCGGFVPSNMDEKILAKKHAIPSECVVRRHGTDRESPLKALLSECLFSDVECRRNKDPENAFRQRDQSEWPGGYFGFFGSSGAAEMASPEDPIRSTWRKEYLPGPTALVATTLCTSLAGLLSRSHPENERLRVTLHRAVSFGSEELLQQCCSYCGLRISRNEETSAGRTFPAKNATIGLAYRCRGMVRSLRDVKPEALETAMQLLNLNAASSKMLSKVRFLIAIPILEPQRPMKFTGANPVAGVIYIDSTAQEFFIDGDLLADVVALIDGFARGLEHESSNSINRIINRPLTGLSGEVPTAEPFPQDLANALELLPQPPPATTEAFQFNFEYTDFMPVRR